MRISGATFRQWAMRYEQVIDLAAEERDYKLRVADRWSNALDAAGADDDGWQQLLRSAAGSGNLVDPFAQTWLRNQLDKTPDQVRAAFTDLRTAGTVDAIDDFADQLRSFGDYVSPGDITCFASMIFLAVDPTIHPPYRAQFVADWAKLVGYQLGRTPRERYAGLLELCDVLTEVTAPDLKLQDRLDAQGLAWAVLKYEPDVRWSPLDQARLVSWRAGKGVDDVVVDRGSGWSPEMEDAAWAVLGAGLCGEASTLVPELQTWLPDVARETQSRIMQISPSATGTFVERLKTQMSGASDEAIVLVAELLYLHSAPLTNVTPETKIGRVVEVLSWTNGGNPLPSQLAAGLSARGSFNGGVGFNVQMWRQLTWLCRFVVCWCELSPERRAEGLRDPFVFHEIALEVPDDVRAIRYSLEYLAWPGIFPWVTSADHRAKIVKAMAADFGGPTGSDAEAQTRDLVSLRQWQERKAGGQPVDWYRSPDGERWGASAAPARRAWLVRPSDGGAPLVVQWQRDGFVSLKAEMLGVIDPGADQAAVRAAIREGYGHVDRSQQEELTSAYHRFLALMKPDDLVVTVDHDRLLVGVITDDPEFVDALGSRLRRAVSWSGQRPLDDLPEPIPSLLEKEGLCVDLTAAYDLLAAYPEPVDPTPDPGPVIVPGPETVPPLQPVTDALARELFMTREPLQEIVDLLRARQQLVLYGPPGTGKTYLAQKLAKHLVGSEDPSRVRLVQFHPSYAYEDFFEGYRPALTEGGLPTFELKPGPLRLMAAEAAMPENRGRAYVLIIDEMNRGNLAKVFGELYFLLEYRHETVRLQYRPGEPFRLPLNLFVIGTMNTADRSIALVDAAIRRRFPFYELHPGQEPVKSVLARFVRDRGIADDRVQLLHALNEAIGIDGRDLHIGPSYLMRKEVGDDGGLERVWRFDILPLLEEHFYGQCDSHQVRSLYGLDALRARTARQTTNLIVEPVAESGDPVQATTDDVSS